MEQELHDKSNGAIARFLKDLHEKETQYEESWAKTYEIFNVLFEQKESINWEVVCRRLYSDVENLFGSNDVRLWEELKECYKFLNPNCKTTAQKIKDEFVRLNNIKGWKGSVEMCTLAVAAFESKNELLMQYFLYKLKEVK